MKKLAILMFFLGFTFCTLQAQNNDSQKKLNNTAVDVQVRNLMQSLTSTYNLNHDQQMTVKKSALALAETVSTAKKLNKSKKEKLKKDFDSIVLQMIPSEKQSHYKNVQIKAVSTILDNIIDSAGKSKSSNGI